MTEAPDPAAARCRTCDRPVGAPRVERSRLVWVCARCADRTDVACDACGTPLSNPTKYADGFGAWCTPCAAQIRTDTSGRGQRRSASKTSAPPPRSAPPAEAPPPREAESEPTPQGPAPAASQAIEIEAEATSGAHYRTPERVLRIACRPRARPAVPVRFSGVRVAAIVVTLALYALGMWINTHTGWRIGINAVALMVLAGIVFLK